MLFKKYLIFRHYLGSNSRSNSGSIFDSQPWVKYLYFKWIWRILLESSRIELKYSCFQPFMVYSQIIIWLWPINTSKNLTFLLKKLANIQYSTQYSTRCSTRYLTRSQVTWPWSIKFTIRLGPSTRLRSQTFSIRLDNESQVGTLLGRNLQPRWARETYY